MHNLSVAKGRHEHYVFQNACLVLFFPVIPNEYHENELNHFFRASFNA